MCVLTMYAHAHYYICKYLINVTINETTYRTDYDLKSLIEFIKFRKRNYFNFYKMWIRIYNSYILLPNNSVHVLIFIDHQIFSFY